MSQDGAAARDSSSSNRLSPPLFQLPENMNDYEVWTVRLPASLNVDSLQGVELDVSESTATFQTQQQQQQQQQWSMTRGQAFENEQFRLLIRDDDDEFLVPHNRPFDRHYNISVNQQQVVEAQLAPRLEMAPEPTDTFRQSYSHIPQVSGLKRRWMPPGGGSVVHKKMICERVNGSIEESVASVPTSADVKSETRASVHSITESVASSTDDAPPSSNQTPKEEPYTNGEHVSSKKKAKKHKKDKKRKKEKKKRRSKSD